MWSLRWVAVAWLITAMRLPLLPALSSFSKRFASASDVGDFAPSAMAWR